MGQVQTIEELWQFVLNQQLLPGVGISGNDDFFAAGFQQRFQVSIGLADPGGSFFNQEYSLSLKVHAGHPGIAGAFLGAEEIDYFLVQTPRNSCTSRNSGMSWKNRGHRDGRNSRNKQHGRSKRTRNCRNYDWKCV